MSDYTLYQTDVFDLFRNGLREENNELISASDWFARAIQFEAGSIAKSRGFFVTLDRQRLDEVRVLWDRDTNRMQIADHDDDRVSVPNHFKQAAVLAYWLRRRMVVTDAIVMKRAVEDYRAEQAKFLIAVNELVAFVVAVRICVYFQVSPSIASTEDVTDVIKSYIFPDAYLYDMCVLLRNKNVSPHALYMVLNSLFTSYTTARKPPNLTTIS